MHNHKPHASRMYLEQPVDEVAAAMISIIDGMSMENTGTFQVVRTGGYEGPTQDISTGTMEW